MHNMPSEKVLQNYNFILTYTTFLIKFFHFCFEVSQKMYIFAFWNVGMCDIVIDELLIF